MLKKEWMGAEREPADGPTRETAHPRHVLLTRRCNQSCGFCDRVSTNQGDLDLGRLRGDVAAAARAGAVVVLTGGEPLLHPGFAELVRLAREAGAARVRVETNAARLAPAGVAAALRADGLDEAHVTVVAVDEAGHARVAGPGTRAEDVLAGIAACLAAGVEVTVRLPIARDVPPAAERLAALRERFPSLERFVLAPAGEGERTLRPGQASPPGEAAREIAAAWEAAAALGVRLTVAPEHVAAPCLTELAPAARGVLADQLLSAAREPGNRATAACAACAIAGRCALTADQVARAGGPRAPAPVADPSLPEPSMEDARPRSAPPLKPGENPYKRLRVLGAADAANFFHVDYEFEPGVDVERPTSRVGVIYHCNQPCTFCQLAEMNTYIPPERVLRALDESYARGSRRVILTGGEPTLSPHLLDYVRHARARGFEVIEMQSNATILDRPPLAEKLREAGLTHAQVSLHGPDSAISDRLTAAPGTHQRTLRGVDHLLEAGVHVLLNHLIFRDNCHLLVDFVEMVDRRWGSYRERVVIQFHAPLNEFARPEKAHEHIARYTEYAPALLRAIDRARALGYPMRDLQDPTGIPALCVLDGDEGYLGPILSQKTRPHFHEWERRWLARAPACAKCGAAEACMGIPRSYLELFGDAEFHPIGAR